MTYCYTQATPICQHYPGAHIEKRQGTTDEAREYCRKTDSRVLGPYEEGSFGREGQGVRSDLAAYNTRVIQLASDPYMDWDRARKVLAREMPGTHMQFSQKAERTFDDYQDDPVSTIVPRPWQAEAIAIVEAPPDDRKIYWYFDATGNAGKSFLVAHLCMMHGGISLSGRVQDMSHAVSQRKAKIALFDLTRTSSSEPREDYYSFAEKVKGRVIFTSKYVSKQFFLPVMHVMFFANFPPPPGIWSEDRLVLVTL